MVEQLKSPMKTFEREQTSASPMFKNDRGTRYSLSYIIGQVASHFKFMFGEFRVYEDEDGQVIIATGLRKDTEIEGLIQHARACRRHAQVNANTRSVASHHENPQGCK